MCTVSCIFPMWHPNTFSKKKRFHMVFLPKDIDWFLRYVKFNCLPFSICTLLSFHIPIEVYFSRYPNISVTWFLYFFSQLSYFTFNVYLCLFVGFQQPHDTQYLFYSPVFIKAHRHLQTDEHWFGFMYYFRTPFCNKWLASKDRIPIKMPSCAD